MDEANQGLRQFSLHVQQQLRDELHMKKCGLNYAWGAFPPVGWNHRMTKCLKWVVEPGPEPLSQRCTCCKEETIDDDWCK